MSISFSFNPDQDGRHNLHIIPGHKTGIAVLLALTYAAGLGINDIRNRPAEETAAEIARTGVVIGSGVVRGGLAVVGGTIDALGEASSSSAPIGITGTINPETGRCDYTVKPGDTLLRIATVNGTTVDALARQSGITDPDSIEVGRCLDFP